MRLATMTRWQFGRRYSSMKGKGQTAGVKVDGMPRFYKHVRVVKDSNDGKFHVKLDDKAVRTPLRNKLVFDNELWATAIAHEWDAQHIGGLKPKTMPLMAYTSTCFDELEDRDEALEDVLKYLQSDTVCFEAPVDQPKLRSDQQRAWRPIREWFEKEFGGPLGVNDGNFDRVQHSPIAIDNVATFLNEVGVY